MSEILFDYSKLRGRIKEKLGTEGKLAEILGISKNNLSSKLMGDYDFKASEIYKTCLVLKIKGNEIQEYFFKEDTHGTDKARAKYRDKKSQ